MSVISPTTSFPTAYIREPTGSHKHTIVALHGLNSTGEIFANRLIWSQSDPPVLQPWLSALPTQHIRFIFPTAPTRTIRILDLPPTVHAWFKISSLTDLEIHQEEQTAGLKESVEHVSNIIDEEILKLEKQGRTSRDLFLLGRSQGSSVVGWTVMTRLRRDIGGVVLTGSWLVLARALKHALKEARGDDDRALTTVIELPVNADALEFARSMLRDISEPSRGSIWRVPILMGHSTDDEWISVHLGRQFRDTLTAAGGQVKWKEYLGAEDEGHWFKEPEEFTAIVDFWLKAMRP